MKVFLFILFISCMPYCYAQKKLTFEEADSLTKAGVPVKVKLDSVSHKMIYATFKPDTIYTLEPLVRHKYDTVLVIQLLADTSERSADNLNQVYWDIGYKIIPSNFSTLGDFDKITYLDIDKKPLLKSIIVWQTKEF